MQEFFVNNQAAILFYTILILIIISVRKHIDWQTFGIGLYRTKVGLKLMQKWGKKYKGLVQVLGYIGLGVGFIGMVFIIINLIGGFWNLLTNPEAAPVVSPVIPGFKVPGFDLHVPLITGWLALFIVIVIHEFSHGVVGRAHGIRIKSSGLLVFGPIGGAFVEPDEKHVAKQHETVKYSLFAAGPWSNVLSALLLMVLMIYAIVPATSAMTQPAGIDVVSLEEEFPALEAGMTAGLTITSVNDKQISTMAELNEELVTAKVGEVVRLGTNEGPFQFQTAEHPEKPGIAYMGVNLKENRVPRINEPWFNAALGFMLWFKEFVNWIILLSLGIGLANLLPIGPLDGGQMVREASRQITGNNKRGDWWWKKISVCTLVLLVVLLIIPFVKSFLF
ncbi:MAG: site-2 protease family protein [Candidatus Woesearchaeota archaeon]|nr:site-2 protease family protein [Candidatus Woesearchaeota archaeon]